MQLIFATQNPNKLNEIKLLIPRSINLVSLEDLGFTEEIPEVADTLEGNAVIKAKVIYEKYGITSFADDTGLEVKELGGKPGVYSARYAGEDKNAESNIKKLFDELKGIKDRSACFRTVIAVISNGKSIVFEGKVEGTIAEKSMGVQGFGYDPVFIPTGFTRSFAQMSLDEKNKISHRGIAIKKFVEWLAKHQN